MKAAILLVALVATAIPVPMTVTPQNGSSIVTSKDRKSGWKAEWGMEQVQLQGKRAVRFNEKGTGRLSAYAQEVRWTAQSLWLAHDTFLPVETEKTVTASDGTVLLVERKNFDRGKGTVTVERLETGQPAETESLDVPADTLALEGLAGVLRFATVDQSHSFSTHVLTNEPKVYSVTFEWRGKEQIKTPAGEFECYKVEMVPRLGVLNLFRPFLPKAYFWFSAAAPHDWIRYQGPESGPGTPDVVMELSRSTH